MAHKTREELIKLNTELEKEAVDWRNADRTRRQEFAKAFGWFKSKQYSNEREPIEPSWPEIYVELGRYLASHDFRHFEGNISELEVGLEEVKNKLNGLHPTAGN